MSRRFTDTIGEANAISGKLQLLLSNDRQHVTKTNRDALTLLHWSVIFEHHQGMLLLLRKTYYVPAFALLRPFEEAFLRSFVAMYGTEKQVAALWNGTYDTDFEAVWKQIDEKFKLEPRFDKEKLRVLHGFTHGGKEQLVRQAHGSDIVSGYTNDEIRALVRETMPTAFLAALFITQFLGYPAEHQSALLMFEEWVRSQNSVQV
jgi:uncharacterized protein DUF6988